ncbi:proliferating cell nuclear antigen [Pyrrhoderma noxium]|uniref:DNA sliding clamp PCNA n=1 Tax=Pyrrhoderma noxium TaxID=2282107 RepID=A0A286UB40_9AGAM|nr:proliferating cell nuclear antigen [Pyrrhoderma noxium]
MPELILGLALSELLDAQTGKQLMNKLSYSDWAINHSFFAAMKGFEVDDEVKDSISFYKWVKSRSSSERRLKLNPERILHDIKDRSKSNHFTKGVACIQAGWILLQTLSRLVQSLTISPLEAVACSYIICSITVYFSWWRKPYNVSERICLENESIESEEQSGNTNNTEVDGLIMELETHLNSKLPSDYPVPWIFFILVGGISGAFNCLSWNFFSTQASLRLAWRICSTILVAYPVMLATTKEIYIRLNSMTRDFRSKKSKIFSMEEPPNSIQNSVTLKKLLDSIKELVTDANFECNEDGLKLQAMDNSHVALVAVSLNHDGFVNYRCDRPMPLGVNLGSLTKLLKCAKDDDICTLKASDDADILSITYEGKASDRIAEFDMKLMDIDADTLGIPDTEYDARVTMSSSELSRIVRDLSLLGESVKIEVSKEGVRFATDGEAANGSVLLKQSESSNRKLASGKDKRAKKEEDQDQEEGSSRAKSNGSKVKKEPTDDDEEMDVEEEEEEEKGSDNGEEEQDQSDEEEEGSRKRRKTQKASKSKKARKADDDDEDIASGGVAIEMSQHVSLTFSLKYLVNFSKSAALSDKVQLMMSNEVPLLVSYDFGIGHIHYYLAPKIGDE